MKTPSVQVRRERVILPTYEPMPADKNPMFIEKRVYQGSSGKVYPLPFYDRISEQKTDRAWDAIWLENEFIELMILPELGGRIHVGRDKTNGYDFFYRQEVIKPALVGLAGPWASGGVEFNWPQHHRPATFMPTATEIERHPDGSITVWCSDHDPMARMKGMHGVCLHPGKAYLELKVRAYNRTQSVQTFLWWANVATRVHEDYQSFFPPDVVYVADHARRSMSKYPLCKGHYYGVDYGARQKGGMPTNEVPPNYIPSHAGGSSVATYAPNDLSFYANIPVPTSYMAMGSKEDFFGGYDHREEAGLVHIANHHISPGKKQWTWGNHEFGYAWDRSLTDPGSEKGECPPYIELMAGVYTDNQPDFSFLMPGETKAWTQYWYPIQKIGPTSHATLEVAASLQLNPRTLKIGIAASSRFAGAIIRLEPAKGRALVWKTDLAPEAPFVKEVAQPAQKFANGQCTLRVLAADGRELLAYFPKERVESEVPAPATEPPLPSEIKSNDELYLTGRHLEQYRHATRDPVPYWREALQRDPGDARCHTALGGWHLGRGEFTQADGHFRAAMERLTQRNANPRDGEALYLRGQTLRHLGRNEEAYACFYKATWNQAWQSAGYHALAELDCRRADWLTALDHLERSLRLNTDNLNARNLRVLVLEQLGRNEEAAAALAAVRALDPLDLWSSFLSGNPFQADAQAWVDLALDLARAGFLEKAAKSLKNAIQNPGIGGAPLINYCLAWVADQMGDSKSALRYCRAGEKAPPDYCFPARVEEIAVLQRAMELHPTDARAPYYLANLYYDRRRHREAITLWEKAVRLDPAHAITWRNLGLGYFNITHEPEKARRAYDRAFKANPADARLLFERDQLWKRMGVTPAKRLRELKKYPSLVAQRDDLSVEYCALCNQVGRPAEALAILESRKFQPWEGGEGQALSQFTQTHLALGRMALAGRDPALAREHFAKALTSPENLSEAKHLLANQSDIYYWLGVACDQMGDTPQAKQCWQAAADFRGDFQEMSVRAYSEMTLFSALAMIHLRRKPEAVKLLRNLLSHARSLYEAKARIDYFATSLPTMLLFDADLQQRQETMALFLEGQAYFGLGQKARAMALFQRVLVRDPAHPWAASYLTSRPHGRRNLTMKA
ncbi:MAG: DUF5107 domain-containing protein [Chthoniobacteraceae bacterium]